MRFGGRNGRVEREVFDRTREWREERVSSEWRERDRILLLRSREVRWRRKEREPD